MQALRIKFYFLLSFVWILSLHIAAQDYYWVGNSGDWSDTIHWATSSGGSIKHSTPPTKANNVYFDDSSFTLAGQVVTINDSAYCKTMDWRGVTNTPTLTANAEWFVDGSLYLDANMTLTGGMARKFPTLTSSQLNNEIDFAGLQSSAKKSLTFNGVGSWILLSDLVFSHTVNIRLLSGTLNTNSYNIDTWGDFISSGDSTRELILNNSELLIKDWLVSGKNMITDPGTSVIKPWNNKFDGGSQDYAKVVFENLSSVTVSGNNIFDSLICTGVGQVKFEALSSQEASYFGFNQSCGPTLMLQSEIEGQPAYLSGNSSGIIGYSLILQDITVHGSVAFTAYNSVALNNVNNWAIINSAGTNYYWIGNGGNWSDLSHWSTTSGGTADQSCLPGSNDNVFFDSNSFNQPNEEVVVDYLFISCNDMIWLGVTDTPTFKQASLGDLHVFILNGSIVLDSVMNYDYQGTTIFNAKDSNNIIDFAGNYYSLTFSYLPSYLGIGPNEKGLIFNHTGTYTLSTDWLNSFPMIFNNGYFDASGHAMEALSITSASLNKNRTIDLSGSSITIETWDVTYSDKLNLIIDQSTIHIKTFDTRPVNDIFNGGNRNYNVVQFSDDIDLIGNNTFDTLQINPAAQLNLEKNSTQIVNKIIADGSCSGFISLLSEGATLQCNSGVINLSQLEIKGVSAVGGASFNAVDAIDLGENSGWNFTPPVGKTYYWVADTGYWDDPMHWSLSSGGISAGCLPTAADDVIFDANSFSITNAVVYIPEGGEVSCHDMTWTGNTKNAILGRTAITFSSNYFTIYIHGSLTLNNAVYLGFYQDEGFTFASSDTGNTITTNGHPLATSGWNCVLKFDGAGSWRLQDNMTFLPGTGGIRLYQGTLDLNGFNLSTNEVQIYDQGQTQFKPVKLNIANSIVNTSSWLVYGNNPDLLTTNSTINQTKDWFYGGGKSYDKLNMSMSTNPVHLFGNNSFTFLKIDAKEIYLEEGSVQTTDSLVIQSGSSCSQFVDISSNAPGIPAELVVNQQNLNLSFMHINDVKASGTANFNTINSTGTGNTSGWNISNSGSNNYYWVNGTGNWSDTIHWSLNSGGAPSGCVPTTLDNVFFDDSSFSVLGQTVTLNVPAYCKSMDWSGAKYFPEIKGGKPLAISGNFLLIDSMQYNPFTTVFNSDSLVAIITGGNTIGSPVFSGKGTYMLGDHLNVQYKLKLNQGTLKTNSKEITIKDSPNALFIVQGTQEKALFLDSSVITINDWDIQDTANFLFNAGSSTIKLRGADYWSYFKGAGLNYHNIEITGNYPYGRVALSGSNNINKLKLMAGSILRLETGATQQIQELAIAVDVLPITIISTESGESATISQPNIICTDNLYIQDITAIGGTYFAGPNSIDADNNSGWIFSSCDTLGALMPDSISSSKGSSLCLGDSTILSISGGTLNFADSWYWYADSCGGNFIGTGVSITVRPTSDLIYYARGEGGAGISPGNCVNIMINVDSCFEFSVVPSLQDIPILTAFPNPFSDYSVLTYSILKEEPVRLIIYNAVGAILQDQTFTDQSVGFHSIKIDTDKFNGSSNIYFVKLYVGLCEYNLRLTQTR